MYKATAELLVVLQRWVDFREELHYAVGSASADTCTTSNDVSRQWDGISMSGRQLMRHPVVPCYQTRGLAELMNRRREIS